MSLLSTNPVTIDQTIAEWFNSLKATVTMNGESFVFYWGNLILCTIAIILCLLLCGIVGLEREKRGRSAGLRTHLLVGLGSCMIMIISIYGLPFLTGTNRDVARLAAQVVAGVGFLGAGAIIHYNGGIKGLTTASTIWLVMSIGLACGSMNFILAILGTVVVMIVLIIFRKMETMVTKDNPLLILLAPSDVPVLSELLDTAKAFQYSVNDLSSQIINDGNRSHIELTFKISSESKEEINVASFVKALEERTKAVNIQVLNHH